jgi:predicted secreted protein
MFMKYAAALLILALGFSNCKAMKPETVTIIYSPDVASKNITVHKGDTLLVKLPMSSGTGFVWELSGASAVCKQGDTKYENIVKGKPGASLVEVINLIATTAGKEEISFVFHRPFERNKPAVDTRVLHLIVQ